MILTDPKAIAIRRRLKGDFEFYATKAVKIRTKSDGEKPFRLNRVQTRLEETIRKQYETEGKVRVIILKARQQGISTYVSARLYWQLSHNVSKKGLVVAHKADSSRALFDMYQNIHRSMPPLLQPSTRYSSRKELVFETLGTAIVVATAGGDGIARGETLTHIHLSEVAFWPSVSASDNLNALMQAIPNAPGTEVYIESTANGMSGTFYELWMGAINGTNGFIPFFSPWFDTPEYRMEAEEYPEWTLDEQDIAKTYGLDDAQLLWRRTQIALVGRDKFEQEYPATPEEAFKSSGRPVFNPDDVYERLRHVPAPIRRAAVDAAGVSENSRGELTIYHDVEQGEVYTIGADVAGGHVDGDYSVAQILDGKKRQVAVWRGRVDPDYFATILYELGKYYNYARIAVESNSHGLLTAIRLGKDLCYPNVYTDIGEEDVVDRFSQKLGFRTTAKTRPLIIDRLRAAIRDGEIEINDRETLQEMLTFSVNAEGKMRAEPGKYDDLVMSLCIANHVHVRSYAPVPVSDDHYITAF